MTQAISHMPRRPSYENVGVCVVCEMDAWSSSTRYRALQHVPQLRSQFARVDVSLPGDTVARHPGAAGRARYFATHAARYARRALTLPRELRGHDSLLVQRGLYPLGPGAVAVAITRFGGRVVLDLDDALLVANPALAAKGRAARWLYGPQQALALLHRADRVVVSSPALAEMLPRWAPEPAILPTVPDPRRYTPVAHREQPPVVIGWAGTVGGLGFLEPLREVFGRLAGEGVAELEVVCSAPWPGPARFRRWRLEDETALFARFGVGIMPLPDTPYTRAKAGFKLLQYMAAAVPVVASPVGVNRELVTRSGSGFLARGADEWEAALRELAASAALRRELGLRGRAFVEGYADLEGQARALAVLLGEP